MNFARQDVDPDKPPDSKVPEWTLSKLGTCVEDEVSAGDFHGGFVRSPCCCTESETYRVVPLLEPASVPTLAANVRTLFR